jgi:hypothetical protein
MEEGRNTDLDTGPTRMVVLYVKSMSPVTSGIKQVGKCTSHLYLPNTFFAVTHTSLAMILMYCRYKSIVAKLIILHHQKYFCLVLCQIFTISRNVSNKSHRC